MPVCPSMLCVCVCPYVSGCAYVGVGYLFVKVKGKQTKVHASTDILSIAATYTLLYAIDVNVIPLSSSFCVYIE